MGDGELGIIPTNNRQQLTVNSKLTTDVPPTHYSSWF